MYIVNRENVSTIMYVHSFSFIKGHTYRECEKYNLLIDNTDELKTIPEKLRYFRLKNCIFQSELAEMIGIDRVTYIDYEKGIRYYPYDVMQRIADVYNMPLDELLDEYHRFIYNNQGRNIKSIRDELGLKQDELANALDISLCVIKKAEQNKVRFLEKNFIKLMSYYNCYNNIKYKKDYV